MLNFFYRKGPINELLICTKDEGKGFFFLKGNMLSTNTKVRLLVKKNERHSSCELKQLREQMW